MSRPGRTGIISSRIVTPRIAWCAIVEAEAVVLGVLRPLDQLHHDVDALALADGGHAEQVLDVEDAEAAHLDVVAEQLGRGAEHHARRAVVALDHVVGDEAVAAHHQLERALALADAALAEQQQADARTRRPARRGGAIARREPLVEQRVEALIVQLDRSCDEQQRRPGRSAHATSARARPTGAPALGALG